MSAILHLRPNFSSKGHTSTFVTYFQLIVGYREQSHVRASQAREGSRQICWNPPPLTTVSAPQQASESRSQLQLPPTPPVQAPAFYSCLALQ